MVVFSDAYIRFSLSSPTCYPRGVYFGDRLCEIGLHAPCDTNPNATPLEANKEYTAPLLFNPWINGMTCVQDELDVQCTGGEIYDCETFLNISVSEIPIQPPHASLPAALTVNWSGGEPEGSLLVKLGEADICEPPISVEQLLPYFEWHNSMGAENPVFRDPEQLRQLISLSIEAGWDPRFIIAIAGKETVYGRTAPCTPRVSPKPCISPERAAGYNFWNWKCSNDANAIRDCVDDKVGDNKWRVFGSFAEAVKFTVDRIRTYKLYTIEEIGRKYEGDTPATIQSWIDKVRELMEGFGYPKGASDVRCEYGSAFRFAEGSWATAKSKPTRRLQDAVQDATYHMSLTGHDGSRVWVLPSGELINETGRGEAAEDGNTLIGAWIPGSSPGNYRISIEGIVTGVFELRSTFVGANNARNAFTRTGVISSGEIKHFDFAIGSDNIAIPLPALTISRRESGGVRVAWTTPSRIRLEFRRSLGTGSWEPLGEFAEEGSMEIEPTHDSTLIRAVGL